MARGRYTKKRAYSLQRYCQGSVCPDVQSHKAYKFRVWSTLGVKGRGDVQEGLVIAVYTLGMTVYMVPFLHMTVSMVPFLLMTVYLVDFLFKLSPIPVLATK